MRSMTRKPSPSGKPGKDERERLILTALVDLYIKTGRPVGSEALREQGLESLSSATIRNYFSKLETQGFVSQAHTSGGRIPTARAYRCYAEEQMALPPGAESEEALLLKRELAHDTRKVVQYLQETAELLSELTSCPVLLSAPRFDQDLVLDIKVVPIDERRSLCLLLTDFGIMHTELLYLSGQLTPDQLQEYLLHRLKGTPKPELTDKEESYAAHLYSEVALRQIISHSQFQQSDLYKTGFAHLLHYPEFAEASLLTHALALFEDDQYLRQLLAITEKKGVLSCWIGEELPSHVGGDKAPCAIAIIPYEIHGVAVGAVGVLGPMRLPYARLFELLQATSEGISGMLSKSLSKHKLTYRVPKTTLPNTFETGLLEHQ